MSNDLGARPGSIRPSGSLLREVQAASSAAPGDAATLMGDAAIRAGERARCYAILSSGYVPGREVEALRLALFTDMPASQATFALCSTPLQPKGGRLMPPAGYAERAAANATAAAAHGLPAAASAVDGPAGDLAAAVTVEGGRTDRGSPAGAADPWAERVEARNADAAGDLAAAVTASGGRTDQGSSAGTVDPWAEHVEARNAESHRRHG